MHLKPHPSANKPILEIARVLTRAGTIIIKLADGSQRLIGGAK